MSENKNKRKGLSDDELENVSGGNDYKIYETVYKYPDGTVAYTERVTETYTNGYKKLISTQVETIYPE